MEERSAAVRCRKLPVVLANGNGDVPLEETYLLLHVKMRPVVCEQSQNDPCSYFKIAFFVESRRILLIQCKCLKANNHWLSQGI